VLDDHLGSTRTEHALTVGRAGTVIASGWAWNQRAKKPWRRLHWSEPGTSIRRVTDTPAGRRGVLPRRGADVQRLSRDGPGCVARRRDAPAHD
jgi:hypothetical protein